MSFRARWCRRWRKYLLRGHAHQKHGARQRRNPFGAFNACFERVSNGCASGYQRLLAPLHAPSRMFVTGLLLARLSGFCRCCPGSARISSRRPTAAIRLHVRAQTGTRIEETAQSCDLVENAIRRIIPPDELDNILDNIGLPYSGINTSYSNTGTIGPADADILVSLKEDHQPDRTTTCQAAQAPAAAVSRNDCSISCPPTW